ncbi:MAG: stage II sporulation protein M [Verrucomicrobia bacterium]|nr:stage II sporulation protein M [Verrucomicrobiota bacterium]
MILDLEKFTAAAQPHWDELEGMLERLESDPGRGFGELAGAQRFYYLYQRAGADLARLATFSSEPALRRRLETLVARAYAELHSAREADDSRWKPLHWFLHEYPRTFRRHLRAFWLVLAITLAGCVFGAYAVHRDQEAKQIILPFSHLLGSPNDRVAQEENRSGKELSGQKTTFSAQLMANNIGVSIKAMAFGMTWGILTVVVLFYNGVILGAVCFDYLRAGEGVFLAGWLLPHGSTEIPAILLGGQAGLVLAGALIGWGQRVPLGRRFRAVLPDMVTLIGGVAILLVWAGIIEAFFSQYHAPVLPYSVKIAFGVVNLAALIGWLGFCGRRTEEPAP